MQVTITAPNGAKVRSASQRRFHVVSFFENGAGEQVASIGRRSDSLPTAREFASKSPATRRVFDSVRKEFV